MKKHNRRKFLQLTATGVGLSLVYLWDKMMENRMLSSANKKIVLPLTNNIVSFYRDFIVINQKQHVKVLSSHCTHLGCIINKEVGGRLVCPCHGSEFDLAGNAVKGPAYKPLPTYPFVDDKNARQIIVQSSNA